MLYSTHTLLLIPPMAGAVGCLCTVIRRQRVLRAATTTNTSMPQHDDQQWLRHFEQSAARPKQNPTSGPSHAYVAPRCTDPPAGSAHSTWSPQGPQQVNPSVVPTQHCTPLRVGSETHTKGCSTHARHTSAPPLQLPMNIPRNALARVTFPPTINLHYQRFRCNKCRQDKFAGRSQQLYGTTGQRTAPEGTVTARHCTRDSRAPTQSAAVRTQQTSRCGY